MIPRFVNEDAQSPWLVRRSELRGSEMDHFVPYWVRDLEQELRAAYMRRGEAVQRGSCGLVSIVLNIN